MESMVAHRRKAGWIIELWKYGRRRHRSRKWRIHKIMLCYWIKWNLMYIRIYWFCAIAWNSWDKHSRWIYFRLPTMRRWNKETVQNPIGGAVPGMEGCWMHPFRGYTKKIQFLVVSKCFNGLVKFGKNNRCRLLKIHSEMWIYQWRRYWHWRCFRLYLEI